MSAIFKIHGGAEHIRLPRQTIDQKPFGAEPDK
jgi:hypothetical protein